MNYNTNSQKIIYIITAIFYLLTSQIYPYIHLHSHEHDGEVEFEICNIQIERKLAAHQCCDSHQNEHQHFFSDRQYFTKKNLHKIHSDLVCSAQTTSYSEPDFSYFLPEMDNIIPASIYLSDNYNKAPPKAT